MHVPAGLTLGEAYSQEANVFKDVLERRIAYLDASGQDFGMILGTLLASCCLSMGHDDRPEAHRALDDLVTLVHRLIDHVELRGGA
jgi:hypothetical protein